LTATAGKPVIDDICRTLRINENGKSTEGLIQSNDPSMCSVKVLSSNRDNIDVSAVFLQNEEQKLHMVSCRDLA
jgi:superfamily II DNA helicase RecQ